MLVGFYSLVVSPRESFSVVASFLSVNLDASFTSVNRDGFSESVEFAR